MQKYGDVFQSPLVYFSIFTVDNHLTCGQWADQMLQRILMENQYIFDIFKASDRYIFVFSACMRIMKFSKRRTFFKNV